MTEVSQVGSSSHDRASTDLRVGVIGADTKASWAGVSHVPAITGIDGLTLAAVATRSADRARAAAASFGAPHWFDDPMAMIGSDAVDIVAVCVRVPAHRDLVMAAIAAGKAIYCEAPLGRSTAEAEEMARSAAATGVHTAIGLQARHNPAARRMAKLVASGAIGRPLSARILSTTVGFGGAFPAAYDYFNQAASGANLLTINGGHLLDLVEAVLGPVTEVAARAPTFWPRVQLIDNKSVSDRNVPDHLSLIGRTEGGAELALTIDAGRAPGDTPFRFELRGTDGVLKLSGEHPWGFQAGDLTLSGTVEFDAPEAPAVTGGLEGAAINVGEIYALLRRDLLDGSWTVPGFDHAVRNSRLIDTVARAAGR